MDKEKIMNVMDSLKGITYKEWKFIYRKVDEYFREESNKLNNEIELADSSRLMSGYMSRY